MALRHWRVWSLRAYTRAVVLGRKPTLVEGGQGEGEGCCSVLGLAEWDEGVDSGLAIKLRIDLSGRIFADGSSVLCKRPHGNESFVPHSHFEADSVGGRGSVQPRCIHVKAWAG